MNTVILIFSQARISFSSFPLPPFLPFSLFLWSYRILGLGEESNSRKVTHVIPRGCDTSLSLSFMCQSLPGWKQLGNYQIFSTLFVGSCILKHFDFFTIHQEETNCCQDHAGEHPQPLHVSPGPRRGGRSGCKNLSSSACSVATCWVHLTGADPRSLSPWLWLVLLSRRPPSPSSEPPTHVL